ncbi:hypothetical protein RIF29_06884 [Crotalaria pallida]|uniref:Uncharacterized protein n=1 Tax=Crotalaria pallida TaxID=3830 RepID=A0AAN9J3Y4_CROPI
MNHRRSQSYFHMRVSIPDIVNVETCGIDMLTKAAHYISLTRYNFNVQDLNVKKQLTIETPLSLINNE